MKLTDPKNYTADAETNLKSFYRVGAWCTIVALIAIVTDVVIGNITGGDLTALPQTAMERFSQFSQNKWLGFYNLDLLNAVVQLILVPGFVALYLVHQKTDKSFALLAFVTFLAGAVIMVGNNTALSMFGLSNKYLATSDSTQQMLLAAAGEAMLARGAHGSPGIFIGFFLPNVANLLMSVVMLKSGVFRKAVGWTGITGSILMMIYVIMVNFVAGAATMATMIAMPGGLLLMTWMILFTAGLFRLAR